MAADSHAKNNLTHVAHLTTMTTSPLFEKKKRYINAQLIFFEKGGVITVVSGLTGRLSCMGVPPSLTIFAFFLCNRLSWFFFIRAISSSSLV